MKLLEVKYRWRILILVFILGNYLSSCEITDEEVSYHHKINITRLFCDSLGNDTHNFYYDEQNKLIMHEWSQIGSGNFNKLDALYEGNTIKIGEYYYTLDSQNRVIRIVHHDTEWNYEYGGNNLIKETYKVTGNIEYGGIDYTIFYQYDNDQLVSDSMINSNYTTVTKYHFSEILRPDFMIDERYGLYELKPTSKYLEESSSSRNYYNGTAGLTVTNVYYSYQIENNWVKCNVSMVETPKVSDNCMEYQIIYTLENP
jgi:hypothetical protein